MRVPVAPRSGPRAPAAGRAPEPAAGGQAPAEAPPELSVLVPVTERPGPLDQLFRGAASALAASGRRAEFVFVVEPAYRALAVDLESFAAQGELVRVLRPGQTLGESRALKVAAEQARAPVVLTLPAYPRVRHEELPLLVEALEEGEEDLVVARRWPRTDSWLNRLQNRTYHLLLRPLGAQPLGDVACGVRVMPRSLLLDLPLYGDFHRFLPFIAAREGYRVREVDARQDPADRAPRIYSPATYLKRVIDLIGIFFLLRFTERPLRFFGLVGTAASALGLLILVVIAVQRAQGVGLADRPLLLLGVLLVVLGMQAVALGLVGEIIVHLSVPARRGYRLRAEDPVPRPGRGQGAQESSGSEPRPPRGEEPG